MFNSILSLEMMKPLLLVLILAAGLRLVGLTFDSLWLDESYQTVVEAYGNGFPDQFNSKGEAFLFSPGKVANCSSLLTNFRRVDPLCPPLYAILINRWLTVFGGSDFALRMFSAVCSLLSIVSIYGFGSALLGKRSGLYAALLQAVSPFDIFYAQEARMYSLLVLLASLAGGSLLCLCFISFKRLNGSPAASAPWLALVYVLSTWAVINTHYTQLFTWFTCITAAVLVFFLAYRNKTFLAYLVISNLAVAILSIPWFSLFLQAAAVRTASFYVIRHSSILWPIWALVVRVPFNWLVFLAGKKVMLWDAPVYLTSAFLITYAVFTVFCRVFPRALKSVANKHSALAAADDQPMILLFLVLWSVLPALQIWFLDVIEIHKVIEISRYLMGTMPAIFLLAGFALYDLEPKKLFFPLVMVHSLFCLANNAYMHIIPQRENWRAVAQIIENIGAESPVIFVCPYYNIVCLDRYLHRPFRQIGVNPNLKKEEFARMIRQLSRQEFWVLSGQEGDTVFDTVPGGYRIVQRYDYPHAVHLRKYILNSK